MTTNRLPIPTLWAMLTALLIGTLIGTMGNSIVSIAIPSIMAYYDIPLTSAVWSITLYTLTFSVLIPVFGSLSRAIGYKRLFISGMVITALSSLLCVVAPNFSIFLAARILIGIGVATILPTIMGIIAHYFPAEIQGRATGYWALINSLGHAFGPVIGGLLLNHFPWQSIFWINLPLAVLSILVAWKVFPKDRTIPNPTFDWPGAAGVTLFVFAGMIAISLADRNGLINPLTLSLLGFAVLTFSALLWYERKTDNPFLNLTLFSRRNYIAAVIPISLQAFTQFGLLVSLPVFLIDVNRVEKQIAGLIIMSMTVMMAVTSPIAGRLTDRISSRRVCLAGTLFIGLAALILFTFRSNQMTAAGWALFALSLMIFGTGFGAIQSSSTVAAIQASPKQISGAATGFFHMIRFISASLGSTVFGILFETGSGNHLNGFYLSFILIIILSALTVPFTFWMSANRSAQETALPVD